MSVLPHDGWCYFFVTLLKKNAIVRVLEPLNYQEAHRYSLIKWYDWDKQKSVWGGFLSFKSIRFERKLATFTDKSRGLCILIVLEQLYTQPNVLQTNWYLKADVESGYLRVTTQKDFLSLSHPSKVIVKK